jgi:hypothetical protein
VEEEVGPCRKGSMPPAHGLRTKGGEGARRHHLGRSIDVGGRRGKTADCGEGGGGRRHRRQRGRRKRQRGGHVQPDRESAGPASESADPAWRQLDLIRRNWEEKRSRRLEEEDGGGGGGAGGGGGDGDNLPRCTAQQLAWHVAQAHYTTIN